MLIQSIRGSDLKANPPTRHDTREKKLLRLSLPSAPPVRPNMKSSAELVISKVFSIRYFDAVQERF